MDYGFVRVAAAIPPVSVADCRANVEGIIGLINEAAARGVQLVVFPELSITAYTCGDLFGHRLLLDEAEHSLQYLLEQTASLPLLSVVGMPVASATRIYNCAVVFSGGKIRGVVPKTYIPNYNEFYEARWFTSGADADFDEITLCGQQVPFGTNLLFRFGRATLGVELCEDLWTPCPPSSYHALQGADIIANLSASDELIGKHDYLLSLLKQQSARCRAAYIYASSGFGESSTDLVFAGNAIVAECGTVVAESERFSFEPQLVVTEVDVERLQGERCVTNTFSSASVAGKPYHTVDCSDIPVVPVHYTRTVAPHPFVPSHPETLDRRCREILDIQISGLAKRLLHTHARTAVIGISGGLDSTLALLVCVQAFDKLSIPRDRIVGVTMPGFGTTDRTYQNAIGLMQALGVTVREIPIREACIQHYNDINHDIAVHDVTYENSQARERTQILMDIANQTNGMVIGTGDLSELALGWATYNGDHMSMYAVSAGIPKTLVKYLVAWVARHRIEDAARVILLDIVDTPISPELIPADEQGNITQKTEDLVGPYELHDFFLYYMLRFGFRPAKIYYLAMRARFDQPYDAATIKKWLTIFMRRFFNQQFKRSCLPDGPKVGSVAISPRGDWRMPSDASSAMWLRECESLE